MKISRHHLLLAYCLLIASFSWAQPGVKYDSSKIKKWFPQYNFNAAAFQKPAIEFAPFARWWWPGNDVEKTELLREINLFADNGFGGVEIQPMNLAMPPVSDSERKKITSWDSPGYYENLRLVMEEARKRGLVVDMTNGSGWPPAGPNLTPDDGFLSLEFSDTTVQGGKDLSFSLPPLPASKNKTTVAPLLQAIVMANLQPDAGSNSKTVSLDAASSKVISSFAQNGTLNYSFPEGSWRVICFWAVPAGEQTSISAAPKPMTVVDHLDSQKVLKLYNYLFDERTGLQPYFGNPMRAVFSDSYEFAVNRHYSFSFLSYFKKQRGYDITPFLPANMQRGYNYVAYMRPKTQPDFSFSKEDWRLQYDYDITISDLLGDHFFKTSKAWAEKQGLLFRTQGYGMNMDMIAMAGQASIPETESMLGSEANLKVMSSGALLYNRPIITAEAVVFINRAYTTTPQKIKIAADKLFAAGVNQIIYHGVPYHYTSEKLGEEGWYPFSSPVFGSINFSSNLGEGNIFWKDQLPVNEYISRTQYALRSGKPHADVLIYYPFLDVGEGTLNNEEEILTRGELEDVEGPLPVIKEEANPAKTVWAKKVFPIINQLEANGITWAWVNDASIQEASLERNGQLKIRGNHFNALILANDSIIQLKTAQKIKALAGNGMRLLATGALPRMQPSYLNWQLNDKITTQSIQDALKAKNSNYLNTESELTAWIKSLPHPIAFNGHYHFTRQAQRDMSDGSRVQFIWNKSNEWQNISLTLDKKFVNSYWLNAAEGTTIKNKGSIINYQLPPYGSVILYASVKKIAVENASSSAPSVTDKSKEIIALNNWDIKTDSVSVTNTKLFDWKTYGPLKYSSAVGLYTSSFEWNNNSPSHFFVDLGKVCFTAEVYVNGKFAGKRIYAPYMLDITPLLKQGNNKIELRITPGQLNGYIGKAKLGDNRYKQFKNKDDQLMSAGLLGPVVVREAAQIPR